MKDEKHKEQSLLLLNNKKGGKSLLKINSSAPTYLPIFKNIGTLKKEGGTL